MELFIERMSNGPDAIAHMGDGRVVFVANGVPGDTCEVRITEEKKRFAKGTVEKVVEPSPNRVTPPCPYAGVCGGCPWAFVARDLQLKAKHDNVRELLVRTGGFTDEEADSLLSETMAPSDGWGYRNKVEIALEERDGRLLWGFHRRDGEGLIAAKRCFLLPKKFQRLPRSVGGGLASLGMNQNLGLYRAGIRASLHTSAVEVALWGRPGAFPRNHVARVLKDGTKATSVVRVLTKGTKKERKVSSVEVLGGKGHWRETLFCTPVDIKETLRISAPSFFQVNTEGAEALVSLALEKLSPDPDETAMDLYCGAGTFTLPLAEKTAWVDAVESAGSAVRDLRSNLEHSGLENVEVIGGSAEREFPEEEADVIVVDPPRAGLGDDVVRMLSDTSARAICYVSCDPATMARDLKEFRRIGAFAPRSIQPVDLFPQTYHVEDVVLLERAR